MLHEGSGLGGDAVSWRAESRLKGVGERDARKERGGKKEGEGGEAI